MGTESSRAGEQARVRPETHKNLNNLPGARRKIKKNSKQKHGKLIHAVNRFKKGNNPNIDQKSVSLCQMVDAKVVLNPGL